MPLFLTEAERQAVHQAAKRAPVANVYWALRRRAERRAASVNLQEVGDTVEWWYAAADHLAHGAMAFALGADERVAAWVRSNALAIARRPVADWVGPPFRDHATDVPVGDLETAHLCWAVAAALDLAGPVFTDGERGELGEVLRDKGLTLCRRWLDRRTTFNNWRAIMNSGVAVAAAVVRDTGAMHEARTEFQRLTKLFQSDGSYGESLHYGNYAALGLVMTAEALLRYEPSIAQPLDITPFAGKVRWDAASHLFTKPLGGDEWGAAPRPMASNFGDSPLVYRPSGDVLLHIAARQFAARPLDAGLARWLFDTHYLSALTCTGADRASFGFTNDLGFLTLPLLSVACEPVPPEQAGLRACESFSCGDVFLRDAWNGKTLMALHVGGEPLRAVAHRHGDLNSFILAHNHELLLADPGHSCYRSLLHDLEASTRTHNSCTFDRGGLTRGCELIEQTAPDRRVPDDEAFEHRGQRLIAAEDGDVRVAGSDAAGAYGLPVASFKRFWLLGGAHALFVIDHIETVERVHTTWNWLLDNRDGGLDLKLFPPDRLVARRGGVGLKMFHLSDAAMTGPHYGFVHDEYHPLPAQRGEGRPGSGVLLRWRERTAATSRVVVHAFAMDELGLVAGWHLQREGDVVTLEAPDKVTAWSLRISADTRVFELSERRTAAKYAIDLDEGGAWSLRALKAGP